MPSAATIRQQIETSLANRIPAALTPRPHAVRPHAPTGIESVDALLEGGLPLGAISELAGPECSGRTSLALSFLARMTKDKPRVRVDRCLGRARSGIGCGGRSGPGAAAVGALRSSACCASCGAVHVYASRKVPRSLRRSQRDCTAAGSGRIRARKRRDSQQRFPDCCIPKQSPRAAPSRSTARQ